MGLNLIEVQGGGDILSRQSALTSKDRHKAPITQHKNNYEFRQVHQRWQARMHPILFWKGGKGEVRTFHMSYRQVLFVGEY